MLTLNFFLILAVLFIALSIGGSMRRVERNLAELIAILSRIKDEARSKPVVTSIPETVVSKEEAKESAPSPEKPEKLAISPAPLPASPEETQEVDRPMETPSPENRWESATVPERAPQKPSFIERFIMWYREDWMQKTGAIVVFFGFLWLASYLDIWDKIGPVGQMTFGLLSGAAFLVFGWWRMQTFVNQGGTFMLLGSGIVLVTTYNYPSLLDQRVAAMVMLSSVALVALAAVKYDRKPFAYVAQLAAFGIPLLALHTQDDMMLFTYLLLVTVGTLWVVWWRGWRGLIVLSLVFVWLYSVPYWTDLRDDRLLLFGYLFSAIFFLAFAVSIVRRGPSPMRVVDIVAILGNGIFIMGWIVSGVEEEWQPLVLAFWAALFASGAYVTSLVSGRRDPFYLHGAVAIVMLALATAKEFSGPALTIAYTFEAAAIAYAGYVTTKRIDIMEKLSALLVIPAIMAFQHLIEYSSWDARSCFGVGYPCETQTIALLGKDFFGVLIFIVVVTSIGVFIDRIRKASSAGPSPIAPAIFLVSSVMGLLLYRAFMHNAFSENVAVFIVLVTYTAIGITLHFLGQARDSAILRWYGNILILIVLGRIFIVDFWSLEISMRIIVAFGVGALLMATAFLRKK